MQAIAEIASICRHFAGKVRLLGGDSHRDVTFVPGTSDLPVYPTKEGYWRFFLSTNLGFLLQLVETVKLNGGLPPKLPVNDLKPGER